MSDEPRLYVLMRTDAPYSSPGKGMAQATHAANQCVYEARQFGTILDSQVTEWEEQTGAGFGTTIVLGCTEKQMRERVAAAKDAGVHAGIVHDPTYPSGIVMPDKTGPTLCALAFVAIVMMAHGDIGSAMLIAFGGTLFWIADLARRAGMDVQPATIPLDTCAYVFGRKSEMERYFPD